MIMHPVGIIYHLVLVLGVLRLCAHFNHSKTIKGTKIFKIGLVPRQRPFGDKFLIRTQVGYIANVYTSA